jgi:hypothetical protein
MFQFPGFASPAYGFSRRYRRSGGLPHSEIHGSTPARGSPWLIATCCVLHRLSVPRHPPDALQTLDLNVRMRHAQEKAHKDLTTHRTHPAKMHHHDPTDRFFRCRKAALSGHPRSLLLFTCQRSHTRPQADICVLSRGYLTARSLKVTVRHCLLLLVEADGIEPTTSCLQSTRSPN